MDEFIVWDKNEEEFLDEEGISINSFGTIIECYPDEEVFNVLSDEDRYTTHRLIKTDDTPEQNKIYADSSIVEFEYYDMDVDSGWVKTKSVITFDDEDLMYLITIDGELCNFKQHDIVNLKVIGNLQQHKRLLGEK